MKWSQDLSLISLAYVRNNQTRISIILRIIALLAMLASTIPFTFLLFKLSEAASSVAFFMLPGPLLIIAGIAVSFFTSTRPALLRLETVFGLLFTYTAGVFGIFSIGGILLLGLLISVPALIIDSILLRPTHSKREKMQTSFAQNILLIIFQLILSALFLFLVASEAIGFLGLIAPFVIVWNVLLFYSVRSYLPNQWLTSSEIENVIGWFNSRTYDNGTSVEVCEPKSYHTRFHYSDQLDVAIMVPLFHNKDKIKEFTSYFVLGYKASGKCFNESEIGYLKRIRSQLGLIAEEDYRWLKTKEPYVPVNEARKKWNDYFGLEGNDALQVTPPPHLRKRFRER